MASDHLKVVVLGAACQGKSALVLRFVSGIFVSEYDPTIEEIYHKLMMVDDDPITLDITDSAGQEEYASMLDLWIEEGHIFLLVYSVNCDAESSSAEVLTPFDHCRLLHSKIVEIKDDPNTPVIVVGTKADLPQQQRNHSKEDGEAMAKEFGLNSRYIEVSAKYGLNLDALWETVAADGRSYLQSNGSTTTLNYQFNANGETMVTPNGPNTNKTGCLSGMSMNCCSRSSAHESSDGGSHRGSSNGRTRVSSSITLGVTTVDTTDADGGTDGVDPGDNTEIYQHNTVKSESEIVEMSPVNEVNVSANDVINALDDVQEVVDDVVIDNVLEELENRKSITIDHREDTDAVSGDHKRSDHLNNRFGSPHHSHGTPRGHPIKLFPVRKVPRDKVFEPILSSKNWKIHRRFSILRFLIAISCGLILPIVLFVQTLAFLCYHEGKTGGFYYPKRYRYNDIHHNILLDFLGIIVGRKSDQDPEIEKDRRWFLRQSGWQKVQRVLGVVFGFITHSICVYNVYVVHFADAGWKVSLLESLGPALLFGIIWVLLSLWIANEQTFSPRLPPLARLRAINLYFGEGFDQTTSAYKFLRGYISLKGDGWNMSWIGISIIFVLSLFYASIPGLTRLTVGDSSDESDRQFMSLNDIELRVELGAIIANVLLMSALMYTVEVQYRKHIEYYRVWMRELTMFLMEKESTPKHHMHDDFDDELSYEPPSQLDEFVSRYFPQNLYLSMKRRCNALGWMEIRSFLECEGKLFFGEQELPILWMLLISMMIVLFVLYRVFFISGNALRSVLFNGVCVLAIIIWASLIKLSSIAAEFENLQYRQELLVETQKFVMRCDETYGMMEDNESESDDDAKQDEADTENDDEQGNEQKPLLLRGGLNDRNVEMRWYARNVGFVEDMLAIIKRKDIYPKLFKTKLNSVLVPVITMITMSAVIIFLKLFAEFLLFD